MSDSTYPLTYPYDYTLKENPMTTLFPALRQKVSENLGDYKVGTLTTSSATVPADTGLQDFPNDSFNDWFLMPSDGTYAGVSRKLQTFVQTGGVMTPYTAFAGATGLVTYELHKFNPTDIRLKINQAAQELYPELWVSHIDEWSLITNNILPNAAVQDWASSTVPDKWTVDTLTAGKNATTAHIRHGLISLSMGTATGRIGIGESENKYLHDLVQKSITLKAWAKTAVASTVRIGFYDTSWHYSSYHTGDGRWHLLTVTATIADPTVNTLEFAAFLDTANTSYIQSMRIIAINVQRYLLPTSFKEVRQVWIQTGGDTSFSTETGIAMCDAVSENSPFERLHDWKVEYDGTDKWLIFPYVLSSERRLKLVGDKYATTLSAETDTIEFEAPQANVIAAKATSLLFRQYGADTAAKNFKRYQEQADRWDKEADDLKGRHGIARPSRSMRT